MSLFDLYILSLRLVQPARVQDVYKKMISLAEELSSEIPSKESVYKLHSEMRDRGIIFQVRKGSYWLSNKTSTTAESFRFQRWVDTERIFLMKASRKAKVQ